MMKKAAKLEHENQHGDSKTMFEVVRQIRRHAKSNITRDEVGIHLVTNENKLSECRRPKYIAKVIQIPRNLSFNDQLSIE